MFLSHPFFTSLQINQNVIKTIYVYTYIYTHTAGADDGIEEIRASGMILQCLQTVTGIKFVITVAIPDHHNMNNNNNNNSSNDTILSSVLRDVLKEIYVLYTECVLKDPFYELEMPIRSDLFVHGVDLLIQHKYTPMLQKVVVTSSTATTTTTTTSTTATTSTNATNTRDRRAHV